MKAYAQKLMATAALGLALIAISIPAWAGTVGYPQVSFGYNGSTPVNASGTLTGARYSADSQQFISCSVESYYGPNLLILCSARNLLGQYLSCSSTDQRLADAVKAMTDSSFISFTVGVYNTCTDLEITNASHQLR